MGKMLGREMDQVERAQLLNMTLHPGYKTLRHMMDQACSEYTADVIKLDPINTEGYREKLANLQMMARCVNDFCASLIKSIEAHGREAASEREVAEQLKQTLNKVEALRSQEAQLDAV